MAGSGRGSRGERGERGADRDDPRAPPREVGSVIRELAAQGPLRKGMTLGRLARAWERVVGPKLAQETVPAGLDEGGLVVACSTAAWGVQVRFLADEIGRRANEVLGSREVRTVRVVVGWEARKPLGRNG